jgi:hypothetical protein
MLARKIWADRGLSDGHLSITLIFQLSTVG